MIGYNGNAEIVFMHKSNLQCVFYKDFRRRSIGNRVSVTCACKTVKSLIKRKLQPS